MIKKDIQEAFKYTTEQELPDLIRNGITKTFYIHYVQKCLRERAIPFDFSKWLIRQNLLIDTLKEELENFEENVPTKDYSKPLAMALDTLNLAILSTPTGELRDLLTQRVITIQNLL